MDGKDETGSFGVSQLDKISMGTIRPGNLGLLYGPPGTGKSSVLSYFLFQGAREDKNVCLITSEPPSTVASIMSNFKGYNQKWLRDGYISILNIYDLVDIAGIDLSSLEDGDQDLIFKLLIQVIDHLDVKRVVIDPINPLLNSLNDHGYNTFFQGFKSHLVDRGASCLIAFDTALDTSHWENNGLSLHDLDLVIRFEKEKDPPMVINTLTIERWRSASHSKTSYVVDVTDEGVIIVPRIKPLEVK
jgi:KaiC/GvpD/RAD55 family RecA-like ATPase